MADFTLQVAKILRGRSANQHITLKVPDTLVLRQALIICDSLLLGGLKRMPNQGHLTSNRFLTD